MALLLAVALQAFLGPAEPQRFAYGAFIAPATLEAEIQSLGAHSKALRPLADCQALSAAFNKAVCASVPVLLLSGGPPTVAGFVVPAIVDTVKTHSGGWALAHVREEGYEGLTPAFTHTDASTAVVAKVRHVRILATLDHVSPRPVFSRTKEAMVLTWDSLHGPSVTTLGGGVNWR